MADYRKIYTEYYGPIPKGWVVHHVNHNHNDNRAWNLLAVPSKTHSSYHALYERLKDICTPDALARDKTYAFDLIKKYYDACENLQQCFNLRYAVMVVKHNEERTHTKIEIERGENVSFNYHY